MTFKIDLEKLADDVRSEKKSRPNETFKEFWERTGMEKKMRDNNMSEEQIADQIKFAQLIHEIGDNAGPSILGGLAQAISEGSFEAYIERNKNNLEVLNAVQLGIGTAYGLIAAFLGKAKAGAMDMLKEEDPDREMLFALKGTCEGLEHLIKRYIEPNMKKIEQAIKKVESKSKD